jgi:NAD(P)-dependent dehydrogenase (short-subunit alcohol dehydrogenase family)
MNIIVTGGASGLGGAITKKLADTYPDSRILITFCNSSTKALELQTQYANIEIVKCDFSHIEEVEAFTEAINSFNPDILINNSYHGAFIRKHFHKEYAEDFLKSYNENIIPVIKITSSALKCFRKKKFGKIINISTSALSGRAPAGTSIYTANKAYIEALSRSWASENISCNITSNCIAPSMMNTSMISGLDERIINEIIEKNPLGRLLLPGEVADVVIFLIRASQHINGITLTMNTGQIAG